MICAEMGNRWMSGDRKYDRLYKGYSEIDI